jgi:hypothetical protein
MKNWKEHRREIVESKVVVMGEYPLILRYDQKQGPSKMNVLATAVQTLRLLIKRRFGF